mgnify:CR=1 FL=1
MQIRSLGFLTNLMFSRFSGSVTDKGSYTLIQTPSNQGYHWGNYIIFDRPPRKGDLNWKAAIDNTDLFSKLQLRHFSYVQVGTVETVVDRVESISFISALAEIQKQEVLSQIRNLVRCHPETKDCAEIKLPYRTDVYWCEKI